MYKRDLVGDHRSSALQINVEEEEVNDPNDSRPLIEFSTTSYAVLEQEQKVVLKVKRTGPTDVDVRFRCLFFISLI